MSQKGVIYRGGEDSSQEEELVHMDRVAVGAAFGIDDGEHYVLECGEVEDSGTLKKMEILDHA